MPEPQPPSVGLCAQIACILEVMARKPGNVHRYADFPDTSFLDYILSAAAIAPVMEEAGQRGIGPTVLEAVRATRRVVSTNTNLGIILLLAPLAAAPPEKPIRHGVYQVLRELTQDDARAVYEAIRLARPGGLGRVPEQDVADEPTLPLMAIMQKASDYDLIARQYDEDFRDVFEAADLIQKSLDLGEISLEDAIIATQIGLMAGSIDTLISRKCGEEIAEQARERAFELTLLIFATGRLPENEVAEFDAWLRADGHCRNPGATADLITAGLFVALRRNTIQLPLHTRFATAGS